MSNLKNVGNEYARMLPGFDEIPKTVLAAIAISALTCGGDTLNSPEDALRAIATEWDILHANGIVPQKPTKRFREAVK